MAQPQILRFLPLFAAWISPIWDLFKILWNYLRDRTDYISDLRIELQSLKEKNMQLNTLNQDVEKKIVDENKQLKQIIARVQDWQIRVQSKQDQVKLIIFEAEEEIRKKYIRYVFPKHVSSFEEAKKKVQSALKAINELIKEGSNFVVFCEKKTYVVDERPVGKTVPLDTKVWDWLEDPRVATIGIYGMGGVGKTTLLTKINNKFLPVNTSLLRTSNDVDVVIWVVVSKEGSLAKIQEAIRQKLNIPDDDTWKSKTEEDRATDIHRFLKQKRFVLLLDDLWKPLDLLKVGVPLLEETNGSKVVFTTRSEEVCGFMGADLRSIKVECLSKEESEQLFKMYVGQKTLDAHPEIPKLAELAAEECKGLPLALITVGRAMAARRDPQQWKDAISVLKSYPSSFSGMGRDVFPVLKYGYEMLPDDMHKRCFQYCSTFPEDHEICKEELIELWIREGILDKFKSLDDAQKFGRYIVGNLKLLCLLEDFKSFVYECWDERVKMHDMIRAMALWLACAEGKGEGKMVVLEHGGNTGTGGFRNWKEMERLSIWGPNRDFSWIAYCTGLQTLIIRHAGLTEVPGEMFQHMHSLNILDLSENENLGELPTEIGKLSNLQHLNLSDTGIRSLPCELGDLENLKSLILDFTESLMSIQSGIMSKLSSLQIFSDLFRGTESEKTGEKELLDELEGLQDMVDMSIYLSSVEAIEKLLNSPTLQRCLKRLYIGFCDNLTNVEVSPSSLRRMEHLEVLNIRYCASLEEVKLFVNDNSNLNNVQGCFANLRHLKIVITCLEDLTWVKYLSSLESIYLGSCNSLVEVIADESGSLEIEQDIHIFSNLRELYLADMDSLESICHQTLLFPSLKTLYVYNCPRLKKLPFDSYSAKSLQTIEAKKEFWEALQWENIDDDTVRHFTSKLCPSFSWKWWLY